MDTPNFNLELERFGNTTDSEKHEILEGRNAKNTNRATKSCITILRDYLSEKQLPAVELLDIDELPDILMDFYTNLRKVDGENYKLQSLKCIRAGINRYMKAEKGIDIISSDKFVKANEMFRGVGKQLRIHGLGSTKSTPVITENDIQKISQYFHHDIMNKPDAKKIQRCVIFNIIYFFCRRGRENLYDMKWNTFQIDFDEDGHRYVYQAIDEHDKNHGIDNPDPANEAKMYENPCKLHNTFIHVG